MAVLIVNLKGQSGRAVSDGIVPGGQGGQINILLQAEKDQPEIGQKQGGKQQDARGQNHAAPAPSQRAQGKAEQGHPSIRTASALFA